MASFAVFIRKLRPLGRSNGHFLDFYKKSGFAEVINGQFSDFYRKIVFV
jgi:hypothetical protein